MGRPRDDERVNAERPDRPGLGENCVECGAQLNSKTMNLCAGYSCHDHVCRECWDDHMTLHELAGMEISEGYDRQVRSAVTPAMKNWWETTMKMASKK